jgi:hypothetical protein
MSLCARRAISFISRLLFVTVVASPAFSQDITLDQLEAQVRSGICPGDLSEIAWLMYEDVCGENFLETMDSIEANQCEIKVDRLNRKISEYNNFIIECRSHRRERELAEELARQKASQQLQRERARREQEIARQRQEQVRQEQLERQQEQERQRQDELARQQEQERQQELERQYQEELARQEEEERLREQARGTEPTQQSREERLLGFCGGDQECVTCLSGWRDAEGRYCPGYLKDSVEKLCDEMRYAYDLGDHGNEVMNRLSNCEQHGF